VVLAEDLSTVDSTVIPNPWKEAVFLKFTERKLKFGYYFDDGVTISSPPVKRAIMETVTQLQNQGHEVVSIVPPNVIEAVRIFLALTSHSGFLSHKCVSNSRYANLRAPLKNDPMESTVWFLLTLGRLPNWVRSVLALVIGRIIRDPVTGSTIRLVGTKSAAQINSWVVRRDALRQEWNDWLQEQKLDALIAPVSTIPAAKINGTSMLGALATSTLLYNVLDWPVGVVPVTTVREKEVMEEARWKGREKEGYSWMFLDRIYGKNGAYQRIMEDGIGLPVGVQVFTFTCCNGLTEIDRCWSEYWRRRRSGDYEARFNSAERQAEYIILAKERITGMFRINHIFTQRLYSLFQCRF
jgi:hypothetical protein